ncbi:MAG: nucleoside-diphosphate sugar epimerase/dehydratase [Eubacteriales bacterium]|nr:nucleoside-diphosphate sugar epimerase/dehydratase [Eubacteriales bacterium]
MLNRKRLTPKKIFLFVYDLGATLIAMLLAIFVTNNGVIPTGQWQIFVNSWFVLPVTALIIFTLVGFYDQMWAFARGSQYLVLVAGTTLQLILSVLVMQIMDQHFNFSTYVVYWFLLTSAVFLIRFIYRFYSSSVRSKKAGGDRQSQIRVMIVGAGEAGSQLINELKNSMTNRVPLLLIDDNPLILNYKNNGVPVLGNRHDIPVLAEKYDIDEIIIAMPSASRNTIRSIVDICYQTESRVSILPFYTQLQNSKVRLADVRDITIEDLLGRDEVNLNLEQISKYIRGKTVLVTGGGGSIGSELVRQIAAYKPAVLLILDIYENSVYDLQQELLMIYGNSLNFQVLIGSVRDQRRVAQIFNEWKPELVFHAAAHKHVPLMEDNPCEAVINNVYGTYNVARQAGRAKAEHFVLISTDKAVNPTNVMGATKRMCEIITLALNKVFKSTNFAAVRFGNVLGSNGSVIPLFERQIKEQKRVTVTDPEVTRYFMTISEASSLVLQASAYAQGGEIFVLDMGRPVKIIDLAKDLIRLSGFVPDEEIPIDIIGLRPGEKLHEELYLDQEETVQTENEKIMTLQQVEDTLYLKDEVQHLMRLCRCNSVGLRPFMDAILCILRECEEKSPDELKPLLPEIPDEKSVIVQAN